MTYTPYPSPTQYYYVGGWGSGLAGTPGGVRFHRDWVPPVTLQIFYSFGILRVRKMKKIPLTKGYTALVDDADYLELSRHKWHVVLRSGGRPYAARRRGKRKEFMHRRLSAPPPRLECDHLNGNSLDNRRSNLRIVTRQQNILNRGMQKNNTSGYRGVSFNKKSGKWIAAIKNEGKLRIVGYYETKELAAVSYNTEAKRMFGIFAHENKLPPD